MTLDTNDENSRAREFGKIRTFDVNPVAWDTNTCLRISQVSRTRTYFFAVFLPFFVLLGSCLMFSSVRLFGVLEDRTVRKTSVSTDRREHAKAVGILVSVSFRAVTCEQSRLHFLQLEAMVYTEYYLIDIVLLRSEITLLYIST